MSNDSIVLNFSKVFYIVYKIKIFLVDGSFIILISYIFIGGSFINNPRLIFFLSVRKYKKYNYSSSFSFNNFKYVIEYKTLVTIIFLYIYNFLSLQLLFHKF